MGSWIPCAIHLTDLILYHQLFECVVMPVDNSAVLRGCSVEEIIFTSGVFHKRVNRKACLCCKD